MLPEGTEVGAHILWWPDGYSARPNEDGRRSTEGALGMIYNVNHGQNVVSVFTWTAASPLIQTRLSCRHWTAPEATNRAMHCVDGFFDFDFTYRRILAFFKEVEALKKQAGWEEMKKEFATLKENVEALLVEQVKQRKEIEQATPTLLTPVANKVTELEANLRFLMETSGIGKRKTG